MKNALRFVFLILVSCMLLQDVEAQRNTSEEFKNDFYRVDSLATNKKNEAALQLILDIGIRARKAGNTQAVIKSVTLRMLFQSYLKGNDLAKHITSLREDIAQAKQPEKSILQSILGEAYWSYYLINKYKIAQRTEIQGDEGQDITLWSASKLEREVCDTYRHSISEIARLQAVKVKDIPDILIGDTSTSYLRPTLYDVLGHRALAVLTAYQLSGNSVSGIADSVENIYKTLLNYHLDHGNNAAWADLSLIKIKQSRDLNVNQQKYLNSLTELLPKAEGTEIYTDVLYEMAAVYKQGNVGISEKTNLITAVELLEKGIKAFPKSNGAKRSERLIKEIKVKSLRMELRSNIIPNTPVQVQYYHKNVDSIYLNIFRISSLASVNFFDNKDNYINFINTRTPIKAYALKVGRDVDYREHSTGDYFEGLPLGSYVLIAQNHRITDTLNHELVNSATKFIVSNLAVSSRMTDRGIQYRVLNSSTGEALKGVKIDNVFYKDRDNLTIPSSIATTDEKGRANVSFDQNSGNSIITLEKDTNVVSFYGGYYRDRPDRRNVLFFKDRPIYRPGQKVFFKGLVIARNEHSTKIMPGEKVEVSFEDVNGEEIQSKTFKTNDYGTFQGSFDIPLGKLNGTMHITTDDDQTEVQVEEYKRPTFEVLYEPFKGRLRFNDTVTVNGKVKMFAGYNVSGAVVKYRIRNRDSLVATGTALTAANGTFAVKFLAVTSKNKNSVSYNINVDVTDNNGETRSATKDFNVAEKDLTVYFPRLPADIMSSQASDSIILVANSANYEPVKAKATARWVMLQAPGRLALNERFRLPEYYTHSKEEFLKAFPYLQYRNELDKSTWKEITTTINQPAINDGQRIILPITKSDFKPGFYKLYVETISEFNDTVNTEHILRMYDQKPETILEMNEWLVSESYSVKPKENAVFRLAGLPGSTVHYEVLYQDSIMESGSVKVGPLQTVLSIKTRDSYKERYAVQFTMLRNGISNSELRTVFINDADRQLQVKFLSFRDKLDPGQKETWKLQISSKAGNAKMAELVATLYDASLEQFRKMDWNYYTPEISYYRFSWESRSSNRAYGQPLAFLTMRTSFQGVPMRAYQRLDYKGFEFNRPVNRGFANYLDNIRIELGKRDVIAGNNLLKVLARGNNYYGMVTDTAGYVLKSVPVFLNGKLVSSTDRYGLYSVKAKPGDNLTIKGFGFAPYTIKLGGNRRFDFTLLDAGNNLSEVTIRGFVKRTRETTTGSSYIVQGKEVADVPVGNVERLLQGKVAGLNIQNNRTPIEEIKIKPGNKLVNVVPRTNFSETAFFYPQLLTNAAGEINVEFTIPQSLTRFKMMGFAHTKDLSTLKFSRELITQKQLSISANAPRFFREGDTISLSAKLNNLSGKALKGSAAIELRDAITGNIINIFQDKSVPEQKFNLTNEGSQAIKWSLVIPKGISAITYKVIAASGKYTDGEEMTIPVLNNSMLVTETMTLNVRGNQSKTFNLEKLTQSGSLATMRNHALTLEFTANPVWYAVQSLPYLMEYPYECAEQTLSRFYANSFATGIINSSPKIKEVFDQWKKPGSETLVSKLEQNPELKSILLEETPWVRNAGNDTERKRRLAVLFDLDRMTNELNSNFDKLEGMQYADGSFPWFMGMPSNRYITQQIVLGMAQLKYLKLVDEKSFPKYNAVLNKALIYLDDQFSKDYKKKTKNDYDYNLPLHYLYARSYSKQVNNGVEFTQALNATIKDVEKDWLPMSIYQQGLAALVLQRNGKHQAALEIVKSLKERAAQSEEMGMSWPENRSGWWWYQSDIETQALMIEVFDEVANDASSVEEMKIWLLKRKQATEWKTTKATTAACYALLMRGYNLLNESAEPEITLGGKSITQLNIPIPEKEAGTGYQKFSIPGKDVKPAMGNIIVKNNNKTIAWGGVYWQYFEQLDKITPAATGVQIKKELFLRVQTDKGEVLSRLTPTNILKTGDLLKVRIEIRCDRPMEYLHLKDMRSAGFEPVSVISQYKYQDGLGYYESTKDASTNFFIGYMPKGTYVFEYPLRVNNAGNFSNGITTLQSMYAPEFSTHSEGIRVTVK
ncbi:alpha-2-macroglobulin family protein [Pedobacter sp. PWIIR3]